MGHEQENQISYLEFAIATADHGAAIPDFELHFASSQTTEFEPVVTLNKTLFAELLRPYIDNSDKVCFALCYKNNTADGILSGSLDICGLRKRV
jgi:hypothetical protein